MELYEVLTSYFRGASTRAGIIHFGAVGHQPEENFALSIRFDGDTLADLHAGPLLAEESFKKLHEYLQAEFVRPNPNVIGRYVLYAQRPITGYWRYRDKFQICPQDEEIPGGLPTHVYRCRLELVHRGSQSLVLNSRRTYERFREIFPILSFLLEGNVWWIGHGGMRSYYWVQIPPSWGSHLPKMAPLPIHPFGLEQYSETKFSSNHKWSQIPKADGKYIEGRWGMDQVNELTIPEDIDVYFDRYFLLPNELRRQFVRACYWMQMSYELSNISESASYQAITQAVEALAHGPEPWKASRSRKDRGPGPTRKFREFLRKHVNLRGIEEQEIDGLYDSFYGVRSNIMHGKSLQHRDEFAHDWSGGNDEWRQKRSLMGIAHAAILSWLEDEAANAIRPDRGNRS